MNLLILTIDLRHIAVSTLSPSLSFGKQVNLPPFFCLERISLIFEMADCCESERQTNGHCYLASWSW